MTLPAATDPTKTPWHTWPESQLVQEFNTNLETGLSTSEADRRREQVGPNQLVESGRKSPLRLLWEQFTSTMVLILIAAAVVSALLGKTTETLAISAIVLLFGLLGFFQEYRAEQAMAALKRLTVPAVRVRRDGKESELSADALVPGDIVLLEAGDLVPADMRLVDSASLRLQEAALTGESEPVDKTPGVLENPELPLGDRRNMAYLGTQVTYGRGRGVVVGTGMDTELGKIAALIQSVSTELTPLQQQLDRVGKQLAAAGVVVALLVLLIGVLSGETLVEMLLTAISVAVAVVPEGLPAVVTVTLALGAQRMLRRRALVRKLPAVETLGSVDVICSDKTGTLTENRMTVTVIDVAGHRLELLGTHKAAPSSLPEAPVVLADQPAAIPLVLAAGALCNDASLAPDPETGRYLPLGDPTEGALLVAAVQAGLDKAVLEAVLPRSAELPFDSDRKRMTTVHTLPADAAALPVSLSALTDFSAPYLALTKGAVDGLLEISTRIWNGTHVQPLDEAWQARILAANEQMAGDGQRVLGLALRPLAELPEAARLEQDLIFIGLVGMIDPPRPEVRLAVATSMQAGVRPVMITGDHPLTARFIAYDLGISTNGRVKTGQDLNHMDDAELGRSVEEVSIYARVSPEHKLRIVSALQNNGHVVAMTGDGVNDSPALKKADIGIAMGVTGTDVAKEAAEMVLVDDNFATIVAAIEEGRVIYDNIRRFVKFSIAGNLGKVLVMLLAPLFGITVALLPLQLLWLNLLTDGLLGLGLGVEPPEPNTMKIPPRDPKASLLGGGLARHVLWVGVLIGVVGLLSGVLFFDPAYPEDKTWQTVMFTALAFSQIGQALATRSSRETFFKLGPLSNPTMLLLAGLVFALQLAVIYVPFLDRFFGVVPLTAAELGIAAALGAVVFVTIELEKVLTRRKR
ncbi:MAG: cation-translocating P-type ATPase [Anaerolineales bacterium]